MSSANINGTHTFFKKHKRYGEWHQQVGTERRQMVDPLISNISTYFCEWTFYKEQNVASMAIIRCRRKKTGTFRNKNGSVFRDNVVSAFHMVIRNWTKEVWTPGTSRNFFRWRATASISAPIAPDFGDRWEFLTSRRKVLRHTPVSLHNDLVAKWNE